MGDARSEEACMRCPVDQKNAGRRSVGVEGGKPRSFDFAQILRTLDHKT